MNLKCVLLVALFVVPCAQGQTEEKASARLDEAILAGRQTTAKQCAAAMDKVVDHGWLLSWSRSCT